ncbi:integrase [Nitratireductor aquibiodomus]|uniref:integrase n=1 Tax=Nitratireductor TaxID=245876 RepID=UPI000DE0C429|nr:MULTISPECIES: integrase [Nitratireductor]MBN7763726.1 integrase [Nitratireductor aquibiodomus]
MSAFQSDVYQAFRSVEVPEDKALKAAEALSVRDKDVNDLKHDVSVVKWMVGFVLAMQLAVFLKAFIPF